MRNNFLHTRIQRDLHNLFEILQINTAGWLQPETGGCTSLGNKTVFFDRIQPIHREEFDRTAAHIFQHGNGGSDRHNRVFCCELSGPVEIFT